MSIDDLKCHNIAILLIQLPVFILSVITYGLSLAILTQTIDSTSIALTQFNSNGLSLNGAFVGVIILGAFLLVSLIGFSILTIFHRKWWSLMLILGLITLVFILPSEALFLKFTLCFSFSNNQIVVARSSMAIILMCFLLIVPFASLLYFLVRNYSISCHPIILVNLILLAPAFAILCMNVA